MRVGDYRVVYEIRDVVLVVRVAHRREVYDRYKVRLERGVAARRFPSFGG